MSYHARERGSIAKRRYAFAEALHLRALIGLLALAFVLTCTFVDSAAIKDSAKLGDSEDERIAKARAQLFGVDSVVTLDDFEVSKLLHILYFPRGHLPFLFLHCRIRAGAALFAGPWPGECLAEVIEEVV